MTKAKAETTPAADGNGEMANAAANAAPVDRPVGPQASMVAGETYILMPTRVLTDVVKILRRLPFEDVELAISDLKKVQPVQAKPPG